VEYRTSGALEDMPRKPGTQAPQRTTISRTERSHKIPLHRASAAGTTKCLVLCDQHRSVAGEGDVDVQVVAPVRELIEMVKRQAYSGAASAF